MADSEEIADTLRDAIQMIEEAQRLVDQVLRGTPSWDHYNAYGKYGFNTLLGSGNPYDSSLLTVLNTFEEDENL